MGIGLKDCISCFFLGLGVGFISNINLIDNKECHQIYYRESKPSVMIFHNSYGFNQVYIETEKGSSKFQEINYYFSKNGDKNQHELKNERKDIERIVNQY